MILRRVIGLVDSNAGVGEIDKRMGANDVETSIEANTKVSNPDGSATITSACDTTTPSIITIM